MISFNSALLPLAELAIVVNPRLRARLAELASG